MGKTIQVGGKTRGLILLCAGLVLAGVGILLYANFGSMRIKTNLGASPETLKYLAAGIPAGIGVLLTILGLVSLLRSGNHPD